MESTLVKEEIKKWLDTVIHWQSNSNQGFNDYRHDELIEFLSQIMDMLSQAENVDEALYKLPQIGQLLGRLCTVPMVVLHEDTYKNLIYCIMWFYTESPKNPVEAKAKSWAISQIKNMACFNDRCKVLDVTGYSQSQFNEIHISEILTNLIENGNEASRSWNSTLGCFVPCCSSVSSRLVNICKLLLHLSEKSYFCEIVESILKKVAICLETKEKEMLLSYISETQKNPYMTPKDVCELSSTSLVILWTSYLPSFEQEIMYLIEFSLQQTYLCRARFDKAMESRYLIKACSENVQLANLAEGMMKTFLESTHGDSRICQLISWFHRSVCGEQYEESHPLFFNDDRNLQALHHILHFPVKVFHQEGIEHHLTEICACLKNTVESNSVTRQNVRFLLLQHNDWYLAALQLAVLGQKKVMKSSSEIICFYNNTHHEESPLIAYFQALHNLLNKTKISTDDIQYVLTFDKTMDQTIWNVIFQVLMIFIIYSQGGLSVADSIFMTIFNSQETPLGHGLHYFLDTLEILLYEVKIVQLKNTKQVNISQLLTSLLESWEINKNSFDLEGSNSKENLKMCQEERVNNIKLHLEHL